MKRGLFVKPFLKKILTRARRQATGYKYMKAVKTFITHTLDPTDEKALADVKSDINFMSNFVRELSKVHPSTIVNENGTYSASRLRDYLLLHKQETLLKAILFIGQAPRSKIIRDKSREYNQAVPIALSVFKKTYGIKYSEWDLSDPRIPVLFGSKLWEALEAAPAFKEDVESLTDEDQNTLRASIKNTTQPWRPKSSTYPALLICMYYQFWIFENPLPGVMIINPFDIDSEEPAKHFIMNNKIMTDLWLGG